MSPDTPASYEAALRRMIELRFQAESSGEPNLELDRLEKALYRMLRKRPNPLPERDENAG